MISKLDKQKAIFQFYLQEYEDPMEMNAEEQQKLRLILPLILKSVIEFIDSIEEITSTLDEKQKLETLVESLQEKLLEQDELNRKLSKTFKELSLITDMASRGSLQSEKQ